MEEHNAKRVESMKRTYKAGIQGIKKEEEDDVFELEEKQEKEKARYLHKRKRTDWDSDDSSDDTMRSEHKEDMQNEKEYWYVLKSVKCNQFKKARRKQLANKSEGCNDACQSYNFGGLTSALRDASVYDKKYSRLSDEETKFSDDF